MNKKHYLIAIVAALVASGTMIGITTARYISLQQTVRSFALDYQLADKPEKKLSVIRSYANYMVTQGTAGLISSANNIDCSQFANGDEASLKKCLGLDVNTDPCTNQANSTDVNCVVEVKGGDMSDCDNPPPGITFEDCIQQNYGDMGDYNSSGGRDECPPGMYFDPFLFKCVTPAIREEVEVRDTSQGCSFLLIDKNGQRITETDALGTVIPKAYTAPESECGKLKTDGSLCAMLLDDGQIQMVDCITLAPYQLMVPPKDSLVCTIKKLLPFISECPPDFIPVIFPMPVEQPVEVTPSGPPVTEAPPSPGALAARAILNSSAVSFCPERPQSPDNGIYDKDTPLQNLSDAAQDKEMQSGTANTGKQMPPTPASPKMLQALQGVLESRVVTQVCLAAITGNDHIEPSCHYRGCAFDINELNGIQVRELWTTAEGKQLVNQIVGICKSEGAKEILYPANDPRHHGGHIHCAF